MSSSCLSDASVYFQGCRYNKSQISLVLLCLRCFSALVLESLRAYCLQICNLLPKPLRQHFPDLCQYFPLILPILLYSYHCFHRLSLANPEDGVIAGSHVPSTVGTTGIRITPLLASPLYSLLRLLHICMSEKSKAQRIRKRLRDI